jgi:hypothetical protein
MPHAIKAYGGKSSKDVKLPNPLHLLPRMSEGTPILPIYVFMAWPGTTGPLPSSLPVIIHAVLTSTPNERQWSRQGRFIHEQWDPDTCWIGPRARLIALEKRKIFCLCRESNYTSSEFPLVAGPTRRPIYPDQINTFHPFYILDWPLVSFRICYIYIICLLFILIFIYLLTGLTPDGSSTVHIYTQTIHRTTQWNNITYLTIRIHKHNNKST